jgi:Type I restriction enzyme HindI endonuclease subunit-like, C-terminal
VYGLQVAQDRKLSRIDLSRIDVREIARGPIETVKKNVSPDWTVKGTVRTKFRLYVKRILKEWGYPPSGQEAARQTVLQQAELLCAGWTWVRMIDQVSLTIAIGAVVVSLFIYWETRNLRKLTQVMVESLVFIAKSRRPSRGLGRPRKPSLKTTQQGGAVSLAPTPGQTPSNPAPPRPPTSAELARIALAQRREERKRLELQLREQREQWKRQKDFAKAIGWVLDRMGSDEEEDYEDDE